jgi:DnaD/phage-associated family protein
MPDFKGFPAGRDDSIPVPEAFFTGLLPVIDDLGEMRITLYAFWNLSGQVREPRYLRFGELLKDKLLMEAFGETASTQAENLADALRRAYARGTLLEARLADESYYFLNCEQGRAAMDGLLSGSWNPEDAQPLPLRLQKERPNIYALYEQNIGPLTPILSETLQDAEGTYSAEWIDDAIRIAVTRNVRNWQYVEAILRSWKEKGRDGTDRKSAEEKRKRDSEGKYGDFVNR